MKEIEQINLTKWPRLLAFGKPLSLEQAYEVILKTTDFTRLNSNYDIAPLSLKIVNNVLDLNLSSYEWESYSEIYDKQFMDNSRYDYLLNDQFYSSSIGGAHGWMNWDGTIHSSNYNIGKWPSTTEVLQEMKNLKEDFPFLEAKFQLCPSEGEDDPVIEFELNPNYTSVVWRMDNLTHICPVTQPRFLAFLNKPSINWDEDLLLETAKRLRNK